MDKALFIQTSFIGDVILATAMLESFHAQSPDTRIDILVRKGNESLFEGHPFVNQVLVWEKKENKVANLLRLARRIRSTRYAVVINAHRFASSGLLTWFSGSGLKVGFHKNPFSFTYTHSFEHEFDGRHETERNHQLIRSVFPNSTLSKPKLYPSKLDYDKVQQYRNGDYVCIAPTSVWYTKQWPIEKWTGLCNELTEKQVIYLLGAPSDVGACAQIISNTTHPNVVNLSGKLSLLQSAALMDGATQNYVNDSAPMHLASSVNASTTAIYCSTIAQFGFGPLSDDARVLETSENLDCRPCGLHGHAACPKGHFNCSNIEISTVI